MLRKQLFRKRPVQSQLLVLPVQQPRQGQCCVLHLVLDAVDNGVCVGALCGKHLPLREGVT